MPRLKVTPYRSLDQLPHEGLREEAEALAADGHEIVAGEALMIPDDGSGTMYGFYNAKDGRGMVAWGMKEDDEMSDWYDCQSLQDLFQQYVANIP